MLTNATVKATRPTSRAYKLGDTGGLFLFVAPSGLRSWRMKFRFAGQEKLLTFGRFPEMPLADARARRDDVRRQLREGIDPSSVRERIRSRRDRDSEAPRFENAARRWHTHQLPRWTKIHADDVIAGLERDAFPEIGTSALVDIDAPTVLRVLRAVEARGCIETARRLRQRISAVFSFAMSEGLVAHDPAAIVAKALQPLPRVRRQPALLDLEDARELMTIVADLDAAVSAKLASRFLALTAVRLAAVRGVVWEEFEDVDWTGDFIGPRRPLWRVPAIRMKLAAGKKEDRAFDHVVPLSAEAVDVLRAARELTAGKRGAHSATAFVFPGRDRRRPLGETAIGALYDRAGYRGRHVPHGWRATFSTILNERFRDERAIIDQALAHAAKDKVEAAYNRAEHMDRRRVLFQEWGRMLASAADKTT
jgi:integrase